MENRNNLENIDKNSVMDGDFPKDLFIEILKESLRFYTENIKDLTKMLESYKNEADIIKTLLKSLNETI